MQTAMHAKYVQFSPWDLRGMYYLEAEGEICVGRQFVFENLTNNLPLLFGFETRPGQLAH